MGPHFFDFSAVGTFPLTLTYPNPGMWEITTAGPGDTEQFSKVECETDWNNGVITRSTSCTTLTTYQVNGVFDPNGTPDLFATVNPAVASVPEPSPLPLLCVGMLGLAPLLRRRATVRRRRHAAAQL